MSILIVALVVLAVPDWKQVKSTDGITVEARPVEGSSSAELRATTTVALSADALCAGAFGTSLADPKEPSLKARKVISESENERVAYDLISPPVVSDRDYAVRTLREKSPSGSCRVTVELANALAPPATSAIVRIEKLRCAWDFEPQSDGRTKVNYVVWTEPKTSLPGFLVESSRQNMMVVWVQLIIERAKAVGK